VIVLKKIDNYLQNFNSKGNPDEAIDKLLEDPIIRRFAMVNDLKHETIVDGINNLMTFQEGKRICEDCHGLYECKLVHIGMTPHLSMYNNDICLDYSPCKYNTNDVSKSKINAYYVPKKVFNADLSDYDMIGDSRKIIHNYIMEFLNKYSPKNPMKGMYLSGPYGNGKTYILAALANEIAKKGYKVTFVYYPDLVRELKSSIGSGLLEEKILELKTTEVLILDDIAGESNTAFIRDEVLGPILQHRVLDELPTFFSSNLKMKSLIDAMALTKESAEQAKAVRVFERVRALAKEFELLEKPVR
jgi:primosomal protein DnaI